MTEPVINMNDKYKVLVVSTDFPPLIGGTARHTTCLCDALSKNGINVHLLTYGQDTEGFDEKQEYRITRINSKNDYGYFNRHLRMPVKLALTIGKLSQKTSFDVIHICNGNYIPLPLRLTSVSKPVIWTIHNLPPAEMSTHIFSNHIINSLFMMLVKIFCIITVHWSLAFGKYDHIIPVSFFIKQKLLEKSISTDILTIVPNGVDKRLIVKKHVSDDSENRHFNILVVARVVEHKGQLEVVRAMPRILEHIPNARCIIVGEAVSQNYLNQILSEIRLNSIDKQSIILTGKLSDAEVNQYLAECDVYIQPSYEEGFCIAIAEAMYAGLPVIGTTTGAIPEFIGKDRGILLSLPNPGDIANAVIKYYDNPKMMEEYAINGRIYIAENYDWNVIAKKTIDIYRSYAQ